MSDGPTRLLIVLFMMLVLWDGWDINDLQHRVKELESQRIAATQPVEVER